MMTNQNNINGFLDEPINDPKQELRFYFWWLPFLLLLTIWFGGFIQPIIVVVLLSIGVLSLTSQKNRIKLISLMTSITETSGLWWAVWACTTIVAIILTLCLLIDSSLAAPKPINPNQKLTTEQQKDRNEQLYDKRLTDRQVEIRRRIGVLPTPKAQNTNWFGWTKGPVNFIERWTLPDQSITGWLKRILMLIILLLTTFLYAVSAFREGSDDPSQFKTARKGVVVSSLVIIAYFAWRHILGRA
jgi:hypothetical protein